MVDSGETMFTKLIAAILLALGLAACSEDINPSVPSPEPINPVTETFTGTLTLNGADTRPFSVSRSGTIRVTLVNMTPDSTITIGLSLGTWNGTACQTVISNDAAPVGTVVVGTADREGRLCARVYDADGTLPQPTDWENSVGHP